MVRKELAGAFHIPEERIRVIAIDTGSAFGGKQRGECEVEAARLARDAGAPVRLSWTREEEFTAAYCRPAGIVEMTAGLDGSGRIHAWRHRNYNSGAASLRPPYTIPHFSCEYHRSESPLHQGSYRSLAGVANTFARESHVDALAGIAGQDALEFRLRNIEDGRLREALERAGERFGWGRRPGAAEGLACNLEKDGRLALFVAMDGVKVRRMVLALDVGAVLNPDMLRNQATGALIQGIGGALFEELTFDARHITNPRLSKYRVPRFSDVPEIEVILIDQPKIPSAGSGEAPITVVAPAIAAALRRQSGDSLRSLPLLGQI
jgi:isoquinoline 1-oxidoreductase